MQKEVKTRYLRVGYVKDQTPQDAKGCEDEDMNCAKQILVYNRTEHGAEPGVQLPDAPCRGDSGKSSMRSTYSREVRESVERN